MKLVISASNTSRVIKGPLQICGSERDLRSLVEQILGVLSAREVDGGKFCYGWIHIRESEAPTLANNPPLPWDEKAAYSK